MDIMSDDYSKQMWKAINSAKAISDLQDALYLVCLRLYEIEKCLPPEHKDLEINSLLKRIYGRFN